MMSARRFLQIFITIALLVTTCSAELLPTRLRLNHEEIARWKRTLVAESPDSFYDGPPDALSPNYGSDFIPERSAEGHALIRSWLGIRSCNSGYYACVFSLPSLLPSLAEKMRRSKDLYLTQSFRLGGNYCCLTGSCCTTTGCSSCASGLACCSGLTCIPTTNAACCRDGSYCKDGNMCVIFSGVMKCCSDLQCTFHYTGPADSPTPTPTIVYIPPTPGKLLFGVSVKR
jgi:hypothetical protein